MRLCVRTAQGLRREPIFLQGAKRQAFTRCLDVPNTFQGKGYVANPLSIADAQQPLALKGFHDKT